MRFGQYDCFSVVLDRFLLDGGAMFGIIPKPLWEKKIASDAKNRIPMTARGLLICGNGKKILVDTGIGNKLPEKMMNIYAVAEAAPMDDILSPYGLSAADITDVVVTHLHFDHTGGATRMTPAGEVALTFENAVYHIQKDQWEYARQPSIRDQGSYFEENFAPLEKANRLNLIDGPVESFFEGIDLLVSYGHTSAQQHLLVRGETDALFFCADLIPTAAHLPLTWHMAYDNEPLTLIAEKGQILDRAVKENWVLCFPHDPEIEWTRVEQGEKGVILRSG